MAKKLSNSISYIVMILSWAVTLFIVADVNILGFHKLQEVAVIVLFVLLSLGIVGFIMDSSKLMLNEFACAALLCIYLKSASNSALQMPTVNEQPHFSVAHINLSSVETGYQEFVSEIKASKLDIISFQEVKPDWAQVLKSSLSEMFPYQLDNVRIDLFGMSVYSKFPIINEDTVMIDNVPFLEAEIELEADRTIQFSNPLIIPSINASMDKTQEQFMLKTAEHISQNKGSKVVLGDFNMVYWSSRIRDFRSTTGLKNSRRDISQSVLSIPYDHIFYSEDLECTKFIDLVDSQSVRLGIQGDFQFTQLKL